MNKIFSNFTDRAGRAAFIADHFASVIKKSASILDVGCSDNDLKKIIGSKVLGIDVSGNPDKKINLEREKLSAFRDNSFELSICTEVLEHVDNFHEITNELIRVSNKFILISLPNCSVFFNLFRIMLTNKTGKFYGLPDSKPEDRHKWFFSWKEADVFFENLCKTNNLKISEKFLNFNYSTSMLTRVAGLFLRVFKIKSFANNYWVLIKKQSV